MKRLSKRFYGPHLLRTEAEDFDEALMFWRQQQRIIKQSNIKIGKPSTLKQKFALSRGQGTLRPITLSDRVRNGRKIRAPSIAKPAVVWTKAQVIEAYKTGSFKPRDLAHRAKVSAQQIKYWCWPNYTPDPWDCCGCQISGWNRPVCPRCGIHWKKRYNIEEL